MRCDQILHFYDTWNVLQIIDEILVEVMKMTPFNNSSWQKAQFCQKQGFNLTIDDMFNFCITNLEQNLRQIILLQVSNTKSVFPTRIKCILIQSKCLFQMQVANKPSLIDFLMLTLQSHNKSLLIPNFVRNTECCTGEAISWCFGARKNGFSVEM